MRLISPALNPKMELIKILIELRIALVLVTLMLIFSDRQRVRNYTFGCLHEIIHTEDQVTLGSMRLDI
jgi:uncharacterized membrane protein